MQKLRVVVHSCLENRKLSGSVLRVNEVKASSRVLVFVFRVRVAF